MSNAPHRRRRHKPRRRTPPGSAPGTLIADPGGAAPVISRFDYGAENCNERRGLSVHEAVAAGTGARWINLDGLGDIATVRRIGEAFGVHALALEDAVNTHQRPKVESYDDHLFIVLRMPDTTTAQQGRLETEQVALCLGRDYVLTFQEHPGDAFEPVRHRLRTSGSRIRAAGPDYLAYALIDAVVDSYFPALEEIGERVEELESHVLATPGPDLMSRIHDLRRDLITARRAVWPLRDMLAALIREDSDLINARTHVYLRDCHDHAIQLLDMIETDREICAGLIELHLSTLSIGMNEVMKLLTIIATIFIPLTFVAGLYGMNFDPAAGPLNMPELGWRYGYPSALALMITIALALVLWFRRKGWLGRGR